MKIFIFDLQRFDDASSEVTKIESGDMTISAGGTYAIASGYGGTITVDTTDAVILDGTDAGELTDAKIVTGSSAVALTIEGLNISNASASPIKFGSGGGALTLRGENILSTSGEYAAAVNIGGGLFIDGTGSLTATASGYGAGIGTDYGEETSANLTIESGTIIASGNYGAGVGSGFQSNVGTISITGGNVTATSSSGAGIGSGANTYTLASAGALSITGGVVSGTSRDGAGIGSGFDGNIGDISIGGTANVNATSTGNGAGIGSGSTFGHSASAGNISIDGFANVVATASRNGAGIGSGYAQNTAINEVGTISVGGDANVTAINLLNSVGIGAGAATGNASNSAGAITLAGDDSTAALSVVVIDNGDDTLTTTINGTPLSGTRLVFIDGVRSNSSGSTSTDTTSSSTSTTSTDSLMSSSSSTSSTAGTSTTSTTTINQVVVSENVSGVTNVGKVDGSDDYIYLGGIGVISDYAGVTLSAGEDGILTDDGAKIRLAAEYLGHSFDGNTLVINSPTGALIVQNCKDKIHAIADVAGNTTALVYSPTAAGVVDGRNINTTEVITGSAQGSDAIFAGMNGSTLSGGSGSFDDTLIGGAGQDVFLGMNGAGNDVVLNYENGDLIQVGGEVNGVNLFGNFALNFADGSLTVANALDRIITVADAAGNVTGQACYASRATTLDGRGLAGVTVLVGGAFGSNLIIAGSSGSSLWGNFGGVDTLVGGAGHDEFVYTPGSGLVFVQGADSNDAINLLNVTGDQISGVAITDSNTTITFTDGGALNVQGNGATYRLEGANYIANRQTNSFVQI